MSQSPDDLERAILRRLRLWAGGVMIVLVAFIVIFDAVAGLARPGFSVNSIILPTLVGALLALVGIASLAKK